MAIVTVTYFSNAAEAELACNHLQAEGLWAMVKRGDLQAYEGGGGGASVEVKEEDLKSAQEILGK